MDVRDTVCWSIDGASMTDEHARSLGVDRFEVVIVARLDKRGVLSVGSTRNVSDFTAGRIAKEITDALHEQS